MFMEIETSNLQFPEAIPGWRCHKNESTEDYGTLL